MEKWQDHGYWVSKQYYWQSMISVLYSAIKYRSLSFFSACNPALSFGGMLADDKTEAYHLVPSRYLPKMITYDSTVKLSSQLEAHHISFPVIVKPNMGFKGFAVRECKDLADLAHYLDDIDIKQDWLIQEYIDKQCEFSIMYYQSPITDVFGITSISSKHYPSILGDGKRNIKELIVAYDNAFVDKDYLIEKWQDQLNEIPHIGQNVVLHHIGNYSRGSKFKSMMNENNFELADSLRKVFIGTEGIYFCRLDIKADSMEAVRKGDFKILEINGAKSEPLHIYDPRYTLWDRIKAVCNHWDLMIKIVDERRSLGDYEFPPTIEAFRSVMAIKRTVKV